MNHRFRLCILLNIVYFILSDASYRQTELYLNSSSNFICSIKKCLRSYYSRYLLSRPVLLGGPGCIVEVDESVLCRQKNIRTPTSVDDDAVYTVWILSAIDNSPDRNFCVFKIANRTIDTIKIALEGKIGVLSLLRRDGHPSYPGVARILAIDHAVTSHSRVLRAPDGTHTINIEGYRAGLNSAMRKEHGFMRDNIDSWLNEYTFKKRYLSNKDRYQFSDIFKEILKLYFN